MAAVVVSTVVVVSTAAEDTVVVDIDKLLRPKEQLIRGRPSQEGRPVLSGGSGYLESSMECAFANTI
jgi:hypothetical protein